MQNSKIRVAIAGYGNLGKGIEGELSKNPDMELVCIFTRRNPKDLKINSNVLAVLDSSFNFDFCKSYSFSNTFIAVCC
jgi:glyceraldehyde-3-phosphate dehydrogenase/erythrose-4-phosphate dehydrogenase